MVQKILLLILVILQYAQAMRNESVPLLVQQYTDYWKLNDRARELLTQSKFQDRTLHVIAIGGPTRAGKSFIMTYLLQKVDKVHFGKFVHKSTMESVTKGMDIALVEHRKQLILLIDCEGLGSLSSKMDPKLMLIMSMISQKMMYLTETFDKNLIANIGTMLANLSQISVTHENKLPLNKILMLLNKTEYVDEGRDKQFFNNVLKQKPDVKQLFDKTFTHQNVLFIGEKPDDGDDDMEEELKQFRRDIGELFTELMKNVKPFRIGGIDLTMSAFLDYLQNNVLDGVNTSTKLCFPNVIGAMFENYANDCIDNAPYVCLSTFSCYQQSWVINNRCNEIERLKDIFDEDTESYSSFVSKIREEYFDRLDDAMWQIRSQNTRIGNQVHHIDTEEREGRFDSWYIERGFWWWSYDWKKSQQWYETRDITVYNDGDRRYGSWRESYCTTRIYKF